MPSIEQTLTLEPGLYTVEGWVKTRDVGAADPRSGVRLCLDARPAANWWQCSDVARGTTDWTLLRVAGIPVRERGSYKVWLGAYGTPDGTAWFDTLSLTVAAQAAARRLPALSELPRHALRRPLADRARGRRDDRAGRPRAAGLLDETSGQARAAREYDAASVADRRARRRRAAGRALPAARRAARRRRHRVGRHPDYRIVKTPARARERLATWYDERNVVALRRQAGVRARHLHDLRLLHEPRHLRQRRRRLGQRSHRAGADQPAHQLPPGAGAHPRARRLPRRPARARHPISTRR